jgi:hypothetical protein
VKAPNIEQHVIRHDDGHYSPSCKVCEWKGKPRANHIDTRAAVLAHMCTKRHRECEAQQGEDA